MQAWRDFGNTILNAGLEQSLMELVEISASQINGRARMGVWLGAAAQSNVDQGPDSAPPEADLATARHLGRRVAEVTLQFERGRAAMESSLAA